MYKTIYTIGHGKLGFMSFIRLIQANKITHIVDIRSIPYSRHAPWSNKSRLADLVKPFNIRYTYLGHKLGGKKTNKSNTPPQQAEVTPDIYQKAINVLLNLSVKDDLTLLCAEGDPTRCHRQSVIAQTLLDAGVRVVHLLHDGSVKEAWKQDTTVIQPDLF